ncbi:MAG TPA: ABC transporter permease [Dehalococcoidia bacterium]|nr:ABC transporter permease [Dehalococcoidia bacterium]
MNKTILILKHEFLHMVKTKSFIIMTLALPVLVLIAMAILSFIQGIEKPLVPSDVISIGYIDEVGGFSGYTEQPGEPTVTLMGYNTPEEATSALLAGEISQYFIIPSDYVATGEIIRYTLERELEPPGKIQWALKSFLLSNLLEGQTSPEVIERTKAPMGLVSIRLDETGQVATDQGGFGALMVPLVVGFLLIISIFSSSGSLLQGLGEEKENRVMEILLSSVSARQLITGKVLGLGAAGLVQVVIWLLSAVFLVRWISTTIGGFISTIQIPDNFLVLGIVYFVLVYLFFAVLMASIGAIGANARDSQQLSMLLILPAWIPLWGLFFFLNNPDHVVSRIFTMIPVTAPLMVFVRLGTSGIPTWELVLSISVLIAGIIGGLVLAAKVFRTFVLMYGKRPRLGEIIRCLREA